DLDNHIVRGVSTVNIQFRDGNICSAVVEVPLVSSDEYLGWSYDPVLVRAVHNSSNYKVAKGHLVKIRGGVGELFEEFTGSVDEIQPTKTTLRITCVGFEARLAQTLSENFPDKLSYAAFGYTERDSVENPV